MKGTHQSLQNFQIQKSIQLFDTKKLFRLTS